MAQTVIERYEVTGLERTEALVWSLVARGLVRLGRLDRALAILDLVPRSTPSAPEDGRLGSPNHEPIVLPSIEHFGRAGACLGQTLARSQFLRRRGVQSSIVLGVRTDDSGPAAHAWLEPFDGRGEYTVLSAIKR